MLEPSAVTPDGELVEDEVERLIIRRHRHSPEVASVVGADWAERLEPHNLLVAATPAENADRRRARADLAAPGGRRVAVLRSQDRALFPWTLAKAFLSSPAALESTVSGAAQAARHATPTAGRERPRRSDVLLGLAERNRGEGSAKYDALVEHLQEIGVGSTGTARVVIFAERVSTLNWLQEQLVQDLQAQGRPGPRPARRPQRRRAAGDRRVLQAGVLPDPGPGHRRRRLRGRQPAPAVPPPGPLRHPVEPDPDRAAQRPHRPLRPEAPPADHHAAARPVDRPLRR